MNPRTATEQIAFRYRPIDSSTGVTRETAKRLAERLGVDETQAIHIALHKHGRQVAAAVRSRCWPTDRRSSSPDQKAPTAR